MCVQVDGVEYEKIGLDLYEMSDVLMTMGLVHAVVRMYTSHTLSHSLTHVYTHALTHTLKLSLSLSLTHTHTLPSCSPRIWMEGVAVSRSIEDR